MSKKSCEAAESIEDALLRMARVNWQQYLLNAQCGNLKSVAYATCRTRWNPVYGIPFYFSCPSQFTRTFLQVDFMLA